MSNKSIQIGGVIVCIPAVGVRRTATLWNIRWTRRSLTGRARW